MNHRATDQVTLPVLTIRQPWASLMTTVNTHTGRPFKQIETRSWRAPHLLVGQRVAIHAGKSCDQLRTIVKADGVLGGFEIAKLGKHAFRFRFANVGEWQMYDDTPPWAYTAPLPLGAILGTARLAACLPMLPSTHSGPPAHRIIIDRWGNAAIHRRGLLPGLTDIDDLSCEVEYGDYAPGRFGWVFDQMIPLDTPVPFQGGQGLSKYWAPRADAS